MKSILLITFILFLSPICQAQDRATDLNKIITSIKLIEKEITSKQTTLSSPQAAGKEVELNKQIVELANQQKSLEHSLEEIASGVNLEQFGENKTGQKISWDQELEDLLAPVLSQIKRATSRPREIEKLRTELSDTDELIQISENALKNLIELKRTSKNLPDVYLAITNLQENWNERKKSLEAKSSILRQKLEQRIGEKKNLSESLEEIFHLFFKSRGKNLLVAFIAAFLFWLGFKRIHRSIHNRTNSREKSFNLRLFNVLFLLGSGFGAIGVFLTVLFFSGDWLLLILSFFLLTGLLWNSKEAISKFWGQTLLLLNIGPVREGERVIYNGLPMRVTSINYNAILENPKLSGPALKLPLKDLLDLRSRIAMLDENWFPTNTGDWIILDSKLASVEQQTVENVLIRFPGGACNLISASKFFGLGAINISSGFRISIVIGMGNLLMEKMSSEILIKMDQDIRNSLMQTQYNQYLVELRVEFEKPGASTLDVAVIADFKGDIARDYDKLRRLLNKLAVQACDNNNWPMPNPQFDIHLRTGNL